MANVYAKGNVSIERKRMNAAGEREGKMAVAQQTQGTGSSAQTWAWPHPSSFIVTGEMMVDGG